MLNYPIFIFFCQTDLKRLFGAHKIIFTTSILFFWNGWSLSYFLTCKLTFFIHITIQTKLFDLIKTGSARQFLHWFFLNSDLEKKTFMKNPIWNFQIESKKVLRNFFFMILVINRTHCSFELLWALYFTQISFYLLNFICRKFVAAFFSVKTKREIWTRSDRNIKKKRLR